MCSGVFNKRYLSVLFATNLNLIDPILEDLQNKGKNCIFMGYCWTDHPDLLPGDFVCQQPQSSFQHFALRGIKRHLVPQFGLMVGGIKFRGGDNYGVASEITPFDSESMLPPEPRSPQLPSPA